MTVDVDIDSDEDFWGKTVSDLQSDIVIGDGTISGTLKYVADYSSAFSGSEASGNYIALHITVPEVDGASIAVKVTNPVVLDSDGLVVLRIADKSTQTITVVASKAGHKPITKVYELSNLECLSSADDPGTPDDPNPPDNPDDPNEPTDDTSSIDSTGGSTVLSFSGSSVTLENGVLDVSSVADYDSQTSTLTLNS